ncbi:hypothetical protein PQQ75_01170 [Paraburkholderia aspalathi]|uniref:hypothetical protein n=1 Tax=Paraburkholderia aspalathi TaxID=1324617 RepID=UPI0038B975A0
MSLFASLHLLAQKMTLSSLITIDGGKLSMNVTPSVAFRLSLLCTFVLLSVPVDVVCKAPEPV